MIRSAFLPPPVDALEGRKLTSDNVLRCPNHSTTAELSAVEGRGVPIPIGDAASQDALHGVGIK